MHKKNILFLCTGNSCRSQMAEGLARHYWDREFSVYSAGTLKHGMNQRAVLVMSEVGLDLSSHYSKTVDELSNITFDYVFTVCGHAHETCPIFPNGKIIHIAFQDPPSLTKSLTKEEEILEVYRRVRDENKEVVLNLKAYL